MLKPVYLDPHEPATLILDGPSLLMTTASHQRHRFPLREIDRLHIAGNIRLDAAALRACISACIPVCFHSSDDSFGFLLASCQQSSRLSDLIQSFLELPDAASHYVDWCKAVERREIITTLKRLGIRAPDLRPSSVEGAILAALPNDKVSVKTLRKLAEGVFALRVAAELAARHVDPLLVAGSSSRLQVITDFARILSWGFYADWRFFYPQTSSTSSIRRCAVDCIESHVNRDVARASSVMEAFGSWLGRTVDQHR